MEIPFTALSLHWRHALSVSDVSGHVIVTWGPGLANKTLTLQEIQTVEIRLVFRGRAQEQKQVVT